VGLKRKRDEDEKGRTWLKLLAGTCLYSRATREELIERKRKGDEDEARGNIEWMGSRGLEHTEICFCLDVGVEMKHGGAIMWGKWKTRGSEIGEMGGTGVDSAQSNHQYTNQHQMHKQGGNAPNPQGQRPISTQPQPQHVSTGRSPPLTRPRATTPSSKTVKKQALVDKNEEVIDLTNESSDDGDVLTYAQQSSYSTPRDWIGSDFVNLTHDDIGIGIHHTTLLLDKGTAKNLKPKTWRKRKFRNIPGIVDLTRDDSDADDEYPVNQTKGRTNSKLRNKYDQEWEEGSNSETCSSDEDDNDEDDDDGDAYDHVGNGNDESFDLSEWLEGNDEDQDDDTGDDNGSSDQDDDGEGMFDYEGWLPFTNKSGNTGVIHFKAPNSEAYLESMRMEARSKTHGMVPLKLNKRLFKGSVIAGESAVVHIEQTGTPSTIKLPSFGDYTKPEEDYQLLATLGAYVLLQKDTTGGWQKVHFFNNGLTHPVPMSIPFVDVKLSTTSLRKGDLTGLQKVAEHFEELNAALVKDGQKTLQEEMKGNAHIFAEGKTGKRIPIVVNGCSFQSLLEAAKWICSHLKGAPSYSRTPHYLKAILGQVEFTSLPDAFGARVEIRVNSHCTYATWVHNGRKWTAAATMKSENIKPGYRTTRNWLERDEESISAIGFHYQGLGSFVPPALTPPRAPTFGIQVRSLTQPLYLNGKVTELEEITKIMGKWVDPSGKSCRKKWLSALRPVTMSTTIFYTTLVDVEEQEDLFDEDDMESVLVVTHRTAEDRTPHVLFSSPVKKTTAAILAGCDRIETQLGEFKTHTEAAEEAARKFRQ
jgi:hypothetical protein